MGVPPQGAKDAHGEWYIIAFFASEGCCLDFDYKQYGVKSFFLRNPQDAVLFQTGGHHMLCLEKINRCLSVCFQAPLTSGLFLAEARRAIAPNRLSRFAC